MPDLGRDIWDDEFHLKIAVSAWLDGKEVDRLVPITRIGQQACGMDPDRARQIARSWEDDGLVETMPRANQVILTPKGQEWIHPEE